jgi:hypothetical protein
MRIPAFYLRSHGIKASCVCTPFMAASRAYEGRGRAGNGGASALPSLACMHPAPVLAPVPISHGERPAAGSGRTRSSRRCGSGWWSSSPSTLWRRTACAGCSPRRGPTFRSWRPARTARPGRSSTLPSRRRRAWTTGCGRWTSCARRWRSGWRRRSGGRRPCAWSSRRPAAGALTAISLLPSLLLFPLHPYRCRRDSAQCAGMSDFSVVCGPAFGMVMVGGLRRALPYPRPPAASPPRRNTGRRRG